MEDEDMDIVEIKGMKGIKGKVRTFYVPSREAARWIFEMLLMYFNIDYKANPEATDDMLMLQILERKGILQKEEIVLPWGVDDIVWKAGQNYNNHKYVNKIKIKDGIYLVVFSDKSNKIYYDVVILENKKQEQMLKKILRVLRNVEREFNKQFS